MRAATAVRLPEAQRRIWLLDMFNDNPAGYLIPMRWHIAGPLDVAALHRALRDVVARHEVLRTSVTMAGREITGSLRPVEQFAMAEHQASDASIADALSRELSMRSMDVESELPFRADLIRFGATDHLLCLTAHHMAFDGGSRDLLYREIELAYEADMSGRPSPLAADPPQYLAYALASEDTDHDHAAAQLEYWRRTLDGLVRFEVPTDHPRPARRSGQGSRLWFDLSEQTSEALNALARQHRASLHMVLVTACQAVLSRRVGRTDVTVGSSYNSRTDPEAASVIGPLVQVAVFRGDASGDPTFRELLLRTRETALDIYEAVQVPFASVVELAEERHDAGRTPLFGILIDLISRRVPPRLAGTEVVDLPAPCLGSKHDLTFGFDGSEGRLRCQLTWDVALYEESTVRRLASETEALIADAAQRPDMRINQLGRWVR